MVTSASEAVHVLQLFFCPRPRSLLTAQNFLDDLRMVENPALSRGDKLHVIERMWRCWGLDGRRKAV